MVSVYVSSFLFIMMVTAEFIYAKSVNALSPATEVTFTDGQLSIPLTQVADGEGFVKANEVFLVEKHLEVFVDEVAGHENDAAGGVWPAGALRGPGMVVATGEAWCRIMRQPSFVSW